MEIKAQLALAAKAAVAAALAWLAVRQLNGVADEYPYYAPLGAVIAVTSTVAGSVRETLQGLASILVGAALVLGVQQLGLPVVVDLAIVVALGTLVSGWRHFGTMASWVPITALFVLIIGRSEPVDYAIAYLGLVGLGALVGIALNVLLPPLPLNPMADSIGRLRGLLASQLDDLAEGLGRDEPPSKEDWAARHRSVRPTTEELQRVVGHATDARRANWRAKRWSEVAEQRYQQARALQQVAFLIEDMTALVVDQERAERENVALGPTLRPCAARSLAATAELLRSVEGQTGDPDRLREADEAVNELARAIRDERHRSSSDMFAAGTIVAGVRRTMSSLAPEDLRGELPSDW